MYIKIFIRNLDLNPVLRPESNSVLDPKSKSYKTQLYSIQWSYIRQKVPDIINTQMFLYDINPEKITIEPYIIEKSTNGENFKNISGFITLHEDCTAKFYRKYINDKHPIFEIEPSSFEIETSSFEIEPSNNNLFINGLFIPQKNNEYEIK